MKKLSLLFVMLFVSIAIFAKGDVKTIVYTTTPIMHCEGCENKIKNQLKFEKGIKKVVTDVENQTVTITYDAKKTSPEKIEASFAKINYTVKQVDPNASTETHACQMECCQKAEGQCKMAEGCGMTEGKCKMAEGKCKMAEGQCCNEKAEPASACPQTEKKEDCCK